jgi:hypothetical protein
MSIPFRELISVAAVPGQVTKLECPAGMVVRLVMATAVIAPAAADDQYFVLFSQGAIVYCRAATNPCGLTQTKFSAAIGLMEVQQLPTNQSIATGNITYGTTPTIVTTTLPDVWWPWTPEVSFAGTAGTVASGLFVYERQPMKRTADLPRTSRVGRLNTSSE